MGSGSSVPFQEQMHVVIVGGGYGGVDLAMRMKKICKTTIIDPKDSMVHNIAALRACVEPKSATKIFIPYEKTFGTSFVRGKVTSIDKEKKCVILESGKEINYTHLVLATGSRSPFPGKVTQEYEDITKEAGIDLYKDVAKEIVEANSIVCVGGGAVGVELAGEIKTEFPDKTVTIIHSNETLCSKKMRKDIQASLHTAIAKKGIELMLGERVANLSEVELNKCVKDQVVRTENGKEVKADLIFKCTGFKFATEAFKDALGGSMNDVGQLRVDAFFKVAETDNIFAIGDITDVEEEKMAYTAGRHAELVANNWKAEIQGTNKKPYKTGQFVMLVPLGRNGGVGEFNGFKLGDFPSKMAKSSGLFISRYWALMEQPVPH